MFIDTHCHIDDPKLADKKNVVKEFVKYGVDIAVNMGCDIESSVAGRTLATEFEQVYFGAGFHPCNLEFYEEKKLDEIAELAIDEKCVAIGEIGLDYHWEGFDKAKQQHSFIAQLELAKALKLPVSVHCRDAVSDMLDIIKNNKEKLTYGGVMHCFSGSRETAKELMRYGFYISFAGTLTFKNANSLIEVAKYVPVDFCLTETDSPYLAPHPYRGTLNEPKNVSLVTARLAEIKNMPVDELASSVMNNARRLFSKL